VLFTRGAGALAAALLGAAIVPALIGAPTASASPSPAAHADTITSPTPADFWLATARGDVWAFGEAGAFGSAANVALAHPVVGITPTSTDDGYWLVASDGGVFSYGDAGFYGSTGAIHLAKPVVGMAPTPDGAGYWLVASDGGIFAFGDAGFSGSMGAAPTPDPAQRVVSSTTGNGYWVVDQNGTVHPFGDASGAPPPQGLMFAAVTPGDSAVLFAFAQLGKPYIWGGNGPVGYDCSGLTLASWKSTGVHFARVANDQYHTAGRPVALSDLQTGDLVFWGSDQSDWTTVYHTALYVGGGNIVESTGDHVQLNSLGQWGSGDLMPVGRRP
jgi:hypothetical protein